MRVSRLAVLTTLVLLVGCWRYRVVPGDCPEPPPAPTSVAVTAGLRDGHRVQGRVVARNGGEGVAEATVNLGPDQAVRTDRDGRFTILVDTVGTYALRVRRVAYVPSVGVVQVVPDTLAVAEVPLVQGTTTLDGCGHVEIRESRPWWKWWYPPAA